jgi:hypothetical protein
MQAVGRGCACIAPARTPWPQRGSAPTHLSFPAQPHGEARRQSQCTYPKPKVKRGGKRNEEGHRHVTATLPTLSPAGKAP